MQTKLVRRYTCMDKGGSGVHTDRAPLWDAPGLDIYWHTVASCWEQSQQERWHLYDMLNRSGSVPVMSAHLWAGGCGSSPTPRCVVLSAPARAVSSSLCSWNAAGSCRRKVGGWAKIPPLFVGVHFSRGTGGPREPRVCIFWFSSPGLEQQPTWVYHRGGFTCPPALGRYAAVGRATLAAVSAWVQQRWRRAVCEEFHASPCDWNLTQAIAQMSCECRSSLALHLFGCFTLWRL